MLFSSCIARIDDLTALFFFFVIKTKFWWLFAVLVPGTPGTEDTVDGFLVVYFLETLLSHRVFLGSFAAHMNDGIFVFTDQIFKFFYFFAASLCLFLEYLVENLLISYFNKSHKSCFFSSAYCLRQLAKFSRRLVSFAYRESGWC